MQEQINFEKTPEDVIEHTLESNSGDRDYWLRSTALIKEVEAIAGAKITGEQLREIIHNLRMRGKPILSSNYGYRWSNSRRELLECSSELNGRAQSISDVAFELARTARRARED